MPANTWEFVVTDLAGNQIGDITNAIDRSVSLQLSRLPTATFKVPTQHPMAGYFIDPNWDGLLKVYRNGLLIFNGPFLTGMDNGDDTGEFVSANAVGPLWRLGFRFLGTSTTGWALGTAASPYDLGFIAQQMLAYGNSQGYTGISNGTYATSTLGSAGTYYFKDVMTAMAEISAGLNSFEFEMAPTEPTNVGQAWPQIAAFNVAALIGSAKPNVIFEYGTTKANAKAYSIQVDRSNMCTKAWIQDPTSTTNSNALTSVDATAETARGRFEALIDNGGVNFNNLRQALADEHVRVRKQARLVVNIVPMPNANPQPLVDYIVGDTIRARVVRGGKQRLDATMRVWGISFTIDQNNNETPTLQLIQ